MVYYKKVKDDILDDFRLMRQQVPVSHNPQSSKSGRKFSEKEPEYTKHMREKIDNMTSPEVLESFTPFDFMVFFKVKSEEVNSRYVPSQGRDLGALKRLQKHFTNEEIAVMIEFLFDSDQNYLDKLTIRPTVLISGWQTTIFNDSQLWLDDKYFPKPKYTKKEKPKREFKEKITEDNNAKIGEWDL